MFTWPSDRNQWLGHRMLQFCTSGQTMVQTPESAIKAVVNPNDLHASRGQAMVQFAAKRWFKSHAAIGERSVSGGLHETERSAVKEAWGYPSGGGRAQVGRSGRQAKRCPNMRAEGTEETTGPAVEQSVSQNRRLEAFIVSDWGRDLIPCSQRRKDSINGVGRSV
jgi:hypothetical protein